jgi:murein DD-endopeptidase MepM/ murein hydrolase activator NlpD
VAQHGSALVWGTRGRWFKSSRSDHLENLVDTNKDYISIVLVPPGSKASKSLHIKIRTLKIIAVSIVVSLILLASTIFINLNSSVQKANYKDLKVENTSQKLQLHIQNELLDSLQHDLRILVEKEEEIQAILGETEIRSKRFKKNMRNTAKKKALIFNNAYTDIAEDVPSQNEQIAEKVDFIAFAIDYSKKNLARLLDKAQQFKSRFAATPSIYPLYGPILSRFGWRNHPIISKRRMHKGIDIAAWAGAPIRSTADGVIEYAGWSGSFGYVVVIDHSYGYRTIYAHCSQLLIKKGDLIKKGQVIAQVGTTGLSTGPHLHYEVRRWRQAVNPVTYLDIDMFTASTQIW